VGARQVDIRTQFLYEAFSISTMGGLAGVVMGLVIAKTLCPVVPMRIFGARAAFPRGGRPHLFQRVTIVVGEPMYFKNEDLDGKGRALYQTLSERVLARIATIELPRQGGEA